MEITTIMIICQTIIYIATLIVLIWQIYELRKSIRSGSFLTVGQTYIPTMFEVVKNPKLSKCFKMYENTNLTSREISEKFFIHILICNFINAYANWKEGFYSENTWNAWEKWFKEWVAGKKFLIEWNTSKNIFSNDIVEFIDKLLGDKNE